MIVNPGYLAMALLPITIALWIVLSMALKGLVKSLRAAQADTREIAGTMTLATLAVTSTLSLTAMILWLLSQLTPGA